MSLTTYLSGYVDGQVRGRGYIYYRDGAVRIIEGSRDHLQALVTGSSTYQVHLNREGRTLYGTCTCPYFQKERETCKHLWATLLTAAKTEYLKGRDKTDPVFLETNLEDKPTDRLSYPLTSLPRSFTEKPHLKPAPPPPTWKDHLAFLRGTLRSNRDEEEKVHWPATRQILYLVDAPATLEGKGLVIEVAHRERKKNGEWGKQKSISDSNFKPESLPDPEDRHILSLLLGSRDASSWYGYSGYGNYGRGGFRRILPLPVQEQMMELFCRTGRCLLREIPFGPGENLLQWDEGEPWEFCLGAEKDGTGRAYVLRGYFQRGADRVALDEPPLLVAGGLVFFEDRVSRLLDYGAFAWISLLRKQKNLVVPVEEGDNLIRELMAMPVFPRLSLPAELQYEEIRTTPRPRLTVVAPEQRNRWHADRLHWKLSFDYEEHTIAYEDPGQGLFMAEPRHFLMRDRAVEQQAYETVRGLGFDEFKSYGEVWREVVSRHLPRAVQELLAAGWHVEAEGRVYRRPGAFSLSVTSEIDWFELNGEVRFDDRTAKLPDLLAALKRGENLIPLDDGTFGMHAGGMAEKIRDSGRSWNDA